MNSSIQTQVRRKKTQRQLVLSKVQTSIENALCSTAKSPLALQRWVKLCLAFAEFVSPSKVANEPARLMKLLNKYPCGLRREELLFLFYEDYQQSSVNRQESLRICLEKMIQRARSVFSQFELTIYFCRVSKRYFALPFYAIENTEKKTGPKCGPVNAEDF